jgi:aminoglycoside phosphotransferase (APT) family kinase protein
VGTVRADLAERGMDALSRLPDGDRLCHGDFHPANIILAKQGPIVIDWPIATRGDAAADVARSLLILRIGELPPGSPMLLRTLEKVGRTVLLWRYTVSYMRAASIRRESIDRWTLPLAIARLSEGIVEERPRLLKFIDTL